MVCIHVCMHRFVCRGTWLGMSVDAIIEAGFLDEPRACQVLVVWLFWESPLSVSQVLGSRATTIPACLST